MGYRIDYKERHDVGTWTWRMNEDGSSHEDAIRNAMRPHWHTRMGITEGAIFIVVAPDNVARSYRARWDGNRWHMNPVSSHA